MNRIITIFTLLALFLTGCNNSTDKDVKSDIVENDEMELIFPKGELISNNYFQGKAWLSRLVTDVENFDTTVGNVIFEPGARNNWHSHPGGQILLCISGKGYYQEKGKSIHLVNVGDVVEIRPNIVHWHGAAPDSYFEHIAIYHQQSKGGVVWLDPVTVEEYNISYTNRNDTAGQN